jgi:MYXO-CTERM domain-containing protein
MADRPHGVLQFGPRADSQPCDLNADSACDALDIDALSSALLTGATETKFDIDGNGTLDTADRTHYIEVVLFTWIGDSNLDGRFSTLDLVDVFSVGGYEDGIGANAGWATGDWSGDLDFTTIDFVSAFASGGYEQGPRNQPVGAVSAVPEPASWPLALLGLLGFGTRRRQTSGTSRG